MRRLIALSSLALAACGPTLLRERPDVIAGGTARVEVARDGHHVAWRGRRFGPFVAVGRDSLRPSPDGQHESFTAEDASGWRVYVDGRPGGAWEGVGELAWAPRGADVAYAAFARGRWHVVGPGDAVGPAFDGVVAGSIRVAGTPPVTAYLARDARGYGVVVGGRAFGPFEAVGALRLDAEGRHFGFVERRGPKAFVHVDAATHGPFDDVAELSLAPTGGAFAAFVLDDEGLWRSLERDGLGPRWSSIGMPVFDARGERLAYAAATGPLDAPSWFVVLDGERLGPFDHVDHRDLRFSARGSRFAFAARRDAEVWVHDGGIPVEAPFRSVSSLGYAPARDVLAFVGHGERDDAIVVGGVVRERAGQVRALRISSDGRRYAATIVRAHGVTLSVDGRHHDYVDVVDATVDFDGEGRRWCALVATAAHAELEIVCDGVATERLSWDEAAALVQAGATGAAPEEASLGVLRARVARAFAPSAPPRR